MNLRKKAILINCCIVLTLMVELRFHSAVIVGISGLAALLTANLALLARARREQRKGKSG